MTCFDDNLETRHVFPLQAGQNRRVWLSSSNHYQIVSRWLSNQIVKPFEDGFRMICQTLFLFRQTNSCLQQTLSSAWACQVRLCPTLIFHYVTIGLYRNRRTLTDDTCVVVSRSSYDNVHFLVELTMLLLKDVLVSHVIIGSENSVWGGKTHISI